VVLPRQLHNKILCGDALSVLKTIDSNSLDCCVTSPPYYTLRDYKVDGQLGREKNPTDYIDKLVEIFDQVKRVLKNKGSCWIVIADSFNKKRSLVGIPERLMIAMMDKGWVLRSKIIWFKRNATPSSAKDRFTPDYEYVYFFTKSQEYYFETQYEPYVMGLDGKPKYEFRYKSPFGGNNNKSGQGAFNYSKPRFIKPNPKGRIKRSVWDIPIETYKDAHFAVFPPALIETPIKATCPKDGIVIDPFMGSGTTAEVALQNNRKFIGIELNKSYVDLANKRLKPLLEQQKLFTRGRNPKMKCPNCGDEGTASWQKGDRWNILHHKTHKPWRCYMLTPETKEKVKVVYNSLTK
jgi:DNA modification methylase